MPIIDALVETKVADSFRVRQVAGMFDLELPAVARKKLRAEIPRPEEQWGNGRWRIGLITGPSGSGKSTLARAAFGDGLWTGGAWANDAAVIEGFGGAATRRVVQMLTAVGFSSPPAWLRPYRTLSNGERFRCELTRALLCGSALVAFDEFTSVVDRRVARIGSAACAKAIRKGIADDSAGGFRQFVAVTCHDDVARWLCPDWQLDLTDNTLTRFGALGQPERLRRPKIRLEIVRVAASAWELFGPHHYLSAKLHRCARCYLGSVEGRPAAFTAVLPFPHAIRPGWREHRTVCLPDFQGIGIGHAMADFIASLYAATHRPYFSTSGHPAMLRARSASRSWRMIRKPGRTSRQYVNRFRKWNSAAADQRLTASFEFIGPARLEEATLFGLAPAHGFERRIAERETDRRRRRAGRQAAVESRGAGAPG